MAQQKPTFLSCASNFSWSRSVRAASAHGAYTVSYGPLGHASKGKTPYGYACSCPDFLWNYEKSNGEHLCKHIVAVKKFRCGWQAEPGKQGFAMPDGSVVCPKCGDPLEEA